MAMMISKFNTLLKSRVLWILILAVIVFAFVFLGVFPMLDEIGQDSARQMYAGELNGENVSRDEYLYARERIRLGLILRNGPDFRFTPEVEEQLNTVTWMRIASIREAKQWNVTADDNEVRLAIQSNFSGENGFDMSAYQSFIQSLSTGLGYTERFFFEYIREEVTMQKLQMLIGSQAFISPTEIRRSFETLTDSFTVEYVAVTPELVQDSIQVSEADARQLFDANPAAFTLPEQRRVKIVAVNVAEQLIADEEVSEDDAFYYYELHMADYATMTTNEDGSPRQEITPFDEVQASIVEAVRKERADERASNVASDISLAAIPDRDGQLVDFDELAQANGLTVVELPAFSRTEVPVPDAGLAFVDAVFDLRSNALDRVSERISGNENYYVAYLQEIIPARVPAFDEVKDQVLAAAEQRALVDAITARAAKVKEDVTTAMAAGQTFAQVAQADGLTVATSGPMTGLSGGGTNEYDAAILATVVSYNEAEVTDPFAAGAAAVVAYVKERRPADPSLFSAYEGQIAQLIRGQRAQSVFAEWQSSLLNPAHFVDHMKVEPYDESDEIDEDLLDDTNGIEDELADVLPED